MEYEEKFQLIRSIVNRYDPWGLLADCPPDEYDDEVKQIVRFLEDGPNQGVLAGRIDELFERNFGRGGLYSYMELAADIIAALKTD